jgi:DNA-binding CsgD family transcriptional regulator
MPFNNLLIDLIDQFSDAHEFDDRWSIAKTAFEEIGGCAVNLGEFSFNQGAVTWMNSSMPSIWVERYVEQDYIKSDRIAQHGLNSSDLMSFDIGWTRQMPVPDAGAQAIDSDLFDLGYRGAMAQTFGRPLSNTRFAVTLMADTTISVLGGPTAHQNFSRIAATLNAYLGAPDCPSPQSYYQAQPKHLTLRERDVLSYLAQGHGYASIAEKLNISNATVRFHSDNARSRLGAATRDQAVALAIRERLIDI